MAGKLEWGLLDGLSSGFVNGLVGGLVGGLVTYGRTNRHTGGDARRQTVVRAGKRVKTLLTS